MLNKLVCQTVVVLRSRHDIILTIHKMHCFYFRKWALPNGLGLLGSRSLYIAPVLTLYTQNFTSFVMTMTSAIIFHLGTH